MKKLTTSITIGKKRDSSSQSDLENQNSSGRVRYHSMISPLSDITNVGKSVTRIGISSSHLRYDIGPSKPMIIDLTNEDAHHGPENTEVIKNQNINGTTSDIVEFWDIGNPTYKCGFCGALFWHEERLSSSTLINIKYSLCCIHGKIQLAPINNPPETLQNLLYGDSIKSKHFQKNIRSYNSMFSFTSMGGNIDTRLNKGNSPPVFKLNGENYHLLGSLLPPEGSNPKFAQLYIYDTENEIANRIHCVRQHETRVDIHEEIVSDVKAMLDENNVLVKSFRMAEKKIHQEGGSNVRLKLIGRRGVDGRRYNLPSVSKVAALVVGDLDESLGDRDIIVETQSGKLHRISELHASYISLQYPLLFPYGEDGYREDICLSNVNSSRGKGRKNVSIREFLAYRLHERVSEHSMILHSRRLFQQFVVDGYTMIESARLTFVRTHQRQLRSEIYNRLDDALTRGETNSSTQGKRIILPSSFTGGARYMIQNYQDAMAICRWAGYPNLFITFTCNPKWPEISRFLQSRGLKPEDRPDIVCRVFKMKLDNLIKDLRHNNIFGNVKAVIYTIEFQKRGLPHAHILLFLSNGINSPTSDDIDSIISAEIPDKETHPKYFDVVRDFMVHGPCGQLRPNSPCMLNGRCTKHFPKEFVESTTIDDDGYPVYKRKDNGRTILKNGVHVDNRFVVPHNQYLLVKYGAHVNIEWCNQSRSIKYLFKYVNKGNDRVTTSFYETTHCDDKEKIIDEVSMYYDCRYISPCEAMWRILGFQIQYKDPPVERLSFHLPDEQNVIFSEADSIDDIVSRPSIGKSMFLAWMEANKKYSEARELTYADFPTKFVWKNATKEWVLRQKRFAIGRIYYVPPGAGENYYLRCLTNIVKGATCHDDIKKTNGVIHNTFRDACYELGLLNDDREYIDGIVEASQWASAHSLRSLFTTLLLSDSLSKPEVVWEKCWPYFSDDILYKQRKLLQHQDLQLSDEEIMNYALVEVENLMGKCGRSLREVQSMPFPDLQFLHVIKNRLIYDEMHYNQETLREELNDLMGKLNEEQSHVFTTILNAVESGSGGTYFVYGYGGTGKTFVWRTLSAAIRSKGEIVLNVASSGIASLLLPGGRTAHSRFAIPINVNEDSTCNIKQGSQLAELIVKCKLIIWDEAPMVHRHCFEALDKSMRDILRFSNPSSFDKPFGGKTVVLGGDFRQILPVIPKGTRQDVVHATVNSSYLWKNCTVLRLTKNMRLQNLDLNDEGVELEKFSEWIASIGDGTGGGPNDGITKISIPDDILLKPTNNPIEAIVSSTYPSFDSSTDDTKYLQGRAILAPTLDVVQSINEYMISLNSLDGKTYLSSDTTCKADSNDGLLHELHTPEFLNGIKCSGVSNHKLVLKVGTPIMLLRNINHSLGLCNGTRLVITKLGSHVLEAKILGGSNAGHSVLIPRMSLTPSDPRIPFKFQRRQFPIIVSYAMTINKSQGQSLSHVGIFLKKPVFSHGQLYVAVSRVTNRRGLKIMLCDKEDMERSSTTNVVFKEVFQNL